MGILSAGLTMSDVERAIAYWEEFEREIDEMPHSEILEAQREPVRTALTVLRAELEREKNPLPCMGATDLRTDVLDASAEKTFPTTINRKEKRREARQGINE